MGAEDARSETTPFNATGTLSLLDAIQQTLKTREMLGTMQQRIQLLERQRSMTRQHVMLDQLDREYQTLRASVSIIAGEFEKMAKFFSDLEITVNGKKMLAEETVEVLMNLKQHLEGLKGLSKNLELEPHGIPALELNATALKKNVQDCVEVWQRELTAYAMMLEMVKIPDSARDLFQSVWTDRNRALRLHIRWKQSTRKWIMVDGNLVEDPRLGQYLDDAAMFAAQENLPDGYEAVLECVTDDTGKAQFNIHVKRPGASRGPSSSGPYAYPYDNASTGQPQHGTPRRRDDWDAPHAVADDYPDPHDE